MKRPSLLALALAALVVGAGVASVVTATAQPSSEDEVTTDDRPDEYPRVDAIVDPTAGCPTPSR